MYLCGTLSIGHQIKRFTLFTKKEVGYWKLNQRVSEGALQKFHLISIGGHSMKSSFLFLLPVTCKGWCETSGARNGEPYYFTSHVMCEIIFSINTLPSCHLSCSSSRLCACHIQVAACELQVICPPKLLFLSSSVSVLSFINCSCAMDIKCRVAWLSKQMLAHLVVQVITFQSTRDVLSLKAVSGLWLCNFTCLEAALESLC